MSHKTSVGWDSSLRKPLASGGPDPSHMLAVIRPSADSVARWPGLMSRQPPRGHHESWGGGQRALFPQRCVTWLIRRRFCVVARLGSGRRGGWGLGWSLLAGQVRARAHLASYLGVTPALQGWRPQDRELGTGEAQAALCLRAQSGDPGSLAA